MKITTNSSSTYSILLSKLKSYATVIKVFLNILKCVSVNFIFSWDIMVPIPEYISSPPKYVEKYLNCFVF